MDDDRDVLRVELQDPKALAAHYTWKKRLFETLSVLVFTALLALMLLRGAHAMDLRADAALLVVAFVSSMVAADLVSGLVHWFADTWGTVEWPIVGPTLVKNFREHHSAPTALAQKGLIETNGDNCMILVPVQLLSLLVPLEGARVEVRFGYAFILGFTFWIMMTNQIHKWAHMRPEDLSWFVHAMQKSRFVLSREEHVVHHTVPFESHYCITTGWLNRPLARIGFFRWMERAIWRMSGAIPRENDIGTEAAVALAVKQGVLPPDFRATRAIEGTRSTPTT
jgi:ubiquitin-conjugating enzyme E2 variant